MRTKHFILLALGGLIAFLAGFFIGKSREETVLGTVTETRETRVDTIRDSVPVPIEAIALGRRRYTLPAGYGRCGDSDSIGAAACGTAAGGEPRCSGDSAMVELPMIQRHYADSTYEAWVSGPLDPRLDSVRVYARTTTVTRHAREPPGRWHLGVNAGYGYGPKGLQPYIGVGLTYSIFSF